MNSVLQSALSGERDVALVMGGGNALGAYHLGAAETLLGAGLRPGWLVGASIGAVTAAILAGAAEADRLERLAELWRQAAQPDRPRLAAWASDLPDSEANALRALLFGRPGLFRVRFPGLFTLLPWAPDDIALRDHHPLAATLERLVDFDRLNAGAVRVSIVALDMETGEEVWFDNRRERIEPTHLLASTALAPLFPPVELDGRLLCDPGFANNLPLDRVFAEPPERDLLCVASDLYSLRGGRPTGLNGALTRVQDLAFASQTRRAIAALRREHAPAGEAEEAEAGAAAPSVALARLAYRGAPQERAGKALDFSDIALARRMASGRADAAALLERLAAAPARPGLTLLDIEQPDEAWPAPDAPPRAQEAQ